MLQIQRSSEYGNCFALVTALANIVSHDGYYTIQTTTINFKCSLKNVVKQTIRCLA